MANFTYAQLEGIWCAAGGPAQYAPMAAAISMAESSGNPNAANHNTNGSVDRGLWQINSTNGAGSTFDVMTNARTAVAMSNKGTNWRPWCTAYSDGACGTKGGCYLCPGAPYQKYLQGGVAPASPPLNATAAAANQTDQATQANVAAQSAQLTAWDPFGIGSTIDSVLKSILLSILNPIITVIVGTAGMAAGGLMVGFGIYMLMGQTQAGQKAQGLAKIGASAAFPELIGADVHEAASGERTIVSRRRRVGGGMKRTVRKYPAPGPRSTQDALDDTAEDYA